MTTPDDACGTVIAILVVALVMVTVAGFLRIDSIKDEAIEHECAQYHPQTGDFEWVDAK